MHIGIHCNMAARDNTANIIHKVNGAESIFISGAGRLVRRWQRTCQYLNTAPFARWLSKDQPGSLILLWHNRLFMGLGCLQEIDLEGRQIYALVSASRDGAKLSAFLNAQGIDTIRGSSSRRGMVAARELLSLLKQGHHVAITVDGPRGPCYQSQPGAAFIAQLSRMPLCCVGAEAETAIELNSWDRFIVPMPFSRVRINIAGLTQEEVCALEDKGQARAKIQDCLMSVTYDRHRELRPMPASKA